MACGFCPASVVAASNPSRLLFLRGVEWRCFLDSLLFKSIISKGRNGKLAISQSWQRSCSGGARKVLPASQSEDMRIATGPANSDESWTLNDF